MVHYVLMNIVQYCLRHYVSPLGKLFSIQFTAWTDFCFHLDTRFVSMQKMLLFGCLLYCVFVEGSNIVQLS